MLNISRDGIYVGSLKQKNRYLEKADFYNLDDKLETIKISLELKRLLLYVRNTWQDLNCLFEIMPVLKIKFMLKQLLLLIFEA